MTVTGYGSRNEAEIIKYWRTYHRIWLYNERRLDSLHVLLDPGEEVSDFRENAEHVLALAGAPGNDADDVEESFLVTAHERTAGISHAGGHCVGAEADHAGLNHVAPLRLQGSVSKNRTVGFLKGGGRENAAGDSLHRETPSGEPAILGALIIIALGRHASGAAIRTRHVHVALQLDQGNVVFDLVRFVEVFVDDDLLDFEGLLRSVAAEKMPFSGFDRIFGGSF